RRPPSRVARPADWSSPRTQRAPSTQDRVRGSGRSKPLRKRSPAMRRLRCAKTTKRAARSLAGSDRHLVRPAEAKQVPLARVGEPEARRRFERHPVGQVPRDHRRQEVACISEAEILRLAQAAVRLDACDEVLAAKPARRARGEPAQRTGDTDGVSELEPFVSGQILLDDEVLGYVPAADGARKNQLGLELVNVLLAQLLDGLA